MSETTQEAKVFTPSQEVIVVDPIMKARNPLVSDPEHEAFFLFNTAKIEYTLPLDRQGNLRNPFASKEEQQWLEKELDVDLNVHKSKDNFWKRSTTKVRLGKLPRKLNLSNPKDYLDYVILRSNPLYIAPSAEKRNDRGTYRFALVSEEYQVLEKAQASHSKKDAYKAAAKLETQGKEAMVNFLKVYGQRVAPESKTEFLIGQIDDIIESDIHGFLEIIKNKEDYDIRLLIEKGVDAGAITKDGRKYHLPGGDPLCAPGRAPVIKEAIEWLKLPKNGDVLDMITARIDNAKD